MGQFNSGNNRFKANSNKPRGNFARGGREFGNRGRDYGGRDKFFSRAREKVREAFTGKGASLAQSVRTLDDLDNTKSLLFERLKEWFSVNFPELSLENEETYCQFVASFGCKEEIDFEKLAAIVGEEKATQIMGKAESSMGSPFTIEEKKAVASLAQTILALFVERAKQEAFIGKEAKLIMPNVAEMADPLVAARLLSAAGSLKKLAQMPASTVQVIGAEKSLFKHLRSHGRTPSPKHGLIFQNALVRGAPLAKRGKIARSLAAKIAIATKADAFSGNFIAPLLKKQLEKRLKRI